MCTNIFDGVSEFDENNINLFIEDQLMNGKPNLVCIGAQKAGTTWLHEVLSERPDVWVPPFKELHFFDHKFNEESKSWTGWHVKNGVRDAKSRHLEASIDPDPEYLKYLDSILDKPMFNGTWYKNIFSRAPNHSVCLDVTPAYSCISELGVSFVANFLKEAKFIYLIRSPLDRALSQLRMDIIRKGTPLTKDEWVKRATMPVLSSRGDYKLNVPLWRSHFDQNRLIFLSFRQIAKDPYGLLRQVEKFAGLVPFEGYTKAKKIIHQTERIEIPKYVIEIIKEKTLVQDQFLNEYFGSEFLK